LAFDAPHSVPLSVDELPITHNAYGRSGDIVVHEKTLHYLIDHGFESGVWFLPCGTMQVPNEDEA
jgi:hypothetical protein